MYFKLELVNREESYNKIFSRSPNIGLMQAVKVKHAPTPIVDGRGGGGGGAGKFHQHSRRNTMPSSNEFASSSSAGGGPSSSSLGPKKVSSHSIHIPY